jgi:hypothetical protein
MIISIPTRTQKRRSHVRNVYFACGNIPYLYNISSSKLYELLGKNLKEVFDYRIIRNVRIHSTEISREEAMLLIVNADNHPQEQHIG